jgi:hypothetical protein
VVVVVAVAVVVVGMVGVGQIFVVVDVVARMRMVGGNQ